jgi:hypothetical protein
MWSGYTPATTQRHLIFNNSAVRNSNLASSCYFRSLGLQALIDWLSSLSSFLWCSVIASNRSDLDWFQLCRYHRDLFIRREAVAAGYLVTQQKCLESSLPLWLPRRRPRLHAVIVLITYWRWYCSWPQGGDRVAKHVSGEEKVFCAPARTNKLMVQYLFAILLSEPG